MIMSMDIERYKHINRNVRLVLKAGGDVIVT